MNKEQLEIYKRAAQKSNHVVSVDAERLLAIIALAEQSMAAAAPHAQAPASVSALVGCDDCKVTHDVGDCQSVATQTPAHETIVQQGDELVCTACGTTSAAPVAEPVIDTADLAAELERQWLAKAISDLRQHGYQRLEDGPFRSGWETALDEIEARCGKPAAQPQPHAQDNEGEKA